MMKVADIMTKEVIKIRNSVKVSEAVRSMRQHNIHTLIVERNHDQDAYGILTAFDIVSKVTAFGRDPRQVRVYEIMTKPCLVLNPELGVEYAAKLLTTTGFHSAPIIQKNLLGILSARFHYLSLTFLIKVTFWTILWKSSLPREHNNW